MRRNLQFHAQEMPNFESPWKPDLSMSTPPTKVPPPPPPPLSSLFFTSFPHQAALHEAYFTTVSDSVVSPCSVLPALQAVAPVFECDKRLGAARKSVEGLDNTPLGVASADNLAFFASTLRSPACDVSAKKGMRDLRVEVQAHY